MPDDYRMPICPKCGYDPNTAGISPDMHDVMCDGLRHSDEPSDADLLVEALLERMDPAGEDEPSSEE